MLSLRCGIILTLITLITNSCDAIADLNRTPRHCVMERAHKMLGYNCARLNLNDVPKNLKASTEVLDISINRIRELTRQSFDSLRDLKYLYVFDNMINRIEDDTFAQLTSLEALDLSGNGLLEVPPEIFNLPLLRNLYLADMHFGDKGFDSLKKVHKPIKAPLAIFSIANNRLTKIPEIGVLPDLYRLNISHNNMRDVTPQQFSPFCKLKEIDLNGTGMERCRCEEVTRFLYRQREADLLVPFYCDAISSECRIDPNVTFAESDDYFVCQKIRRTVMEHKQAQLTWGIVAIGVIGFLIFFIGCLYCIHRHNVRKMRKRSKLNNQNVTMVPAKQLEANEIESSENNSNIESTNPEKLLIKKSNV